MAIIRYQVRRAKNRKERAQGKRFIAQAVFPGGRKIIYARTRTRGPAIQKIEQVVRIAAQEYDTQTGAGSPGGGGSGGGAYDPGGGAPGKRRPAPELG